MANTRIALPLQQVLSSGGKPIVGGKLYIYTAGTSTLATTYSNSTLTSTNTNPVVADSNGMFGDIFAPTSPTVLNYDLVYKTAFDVTIKQFNNISVGATENTFVANMTNIEAGVQHASGNVDYNFSALISESGV